MTTIAERPEIAGGVISHATGLVIEPELSFNEWRRLMDRLLETSDRALWSLGDARLYGERFAKDYHDGLAALDAASKQVTASARVARAFAPERRRGQLSFEMHELVAGLEEPEQERWLDDAERQGWKQRQLHLALGQALERVKQPALSVKIVDDHYRIALAKAERRGMDPKEWLLEAIRNYDGPVPELEAAA